MKTKNHYAQKMWRRVLSIRLVATVLLSIACVAGFSQQYTYKGSVKDPSGVPLPGVNVIEQGTSNGTITNVEGNFTLSSDKEPVVIEISFVGFQTQAVEANSGEAIDITLEEDIAELDEIVVIGYGVQKKSLVTGAISSIDNDDIENTPVQRAEQALQGKTAGVFVLPASGSPGADMKVRVRGTGSNGSSNPLYIVDGVKYDNISFLDPNDIASLEVLKDAASAAIYGAEGANGVVIISSKSGKKGMDGIVSYNFQYGVQSAPKLPELMNRQQYLDYHTKAGTQMAEGTIADQPSDADTKWLEEIFEDAPLQKHHLSFTGGSEKGTYSTSFSYLDQDGIIGGSKSNYKRVTARINTTYDVKEWLKVGANLSYSNTNRGSIEEDDEFGGVVASALYIDPATPTHYDANNLPAHMLKDGQPKNNYRKDSDGRYFAVSKNIQSEIVNPLLTIDLAQGETKADNVLGSFFVEINPFEGLTITSRAGIDYYYQRYHYWNPSYYYSKERNNSTVNVLDETHQHRKWQWENFATYAKQFNQHNLSVTAGMAAESLEHYKLYVQSSQMLFEEDKYAEHFSTSGDGKIDEGRTYDESLVSYFGRLMYDYDNRYMVQFTIRKDGASMSMVPSDNQFGTYPSFSLGWNVSEEAFWTVDFVNHLKLRGSWGQNGSLSNLRSQWRYYDNYSPYREMNPFPYLPALTSENIIYTDAAGNVVTGMAPTVLANPDLTWETSEQTNLGLDLRMWQSRISFGMDYYIKKTKGLLCIYAPPATSGANAPFYNTGTVENKGFEFNLGIRNHEGDFNYSVNMNLATLKNEVTEFDAIVDRVYGRRVGPGGDDAIAMEKGEPLWYFRGYESTGLDANGMPVFKDISGPNGVPDGVIDDNDKTNIGNPHPKLIYGANINLEYKGLELGIFLQGTYGNDILNGWNRPDKKSGNYLAEVYTGAGSDYPDPSVINDPDLAGQYFRSDYFVYDGSYLRVKQIQLGYTLPSSIINTIKFKSAKVYVSLDDYFTFTKYPGIDPEAGSGDDASLGVDRGMYPVARKMMFGLNVTF